MVEMIKGRPRAGISFEQAFALHALELGTLFMLSACALLCSWWATNSSKTILGQNMDWYPGFSRPAGVTMPMEQFNSRVSGWFCRYSQFSGLWHAPIHHDSVEGFRLNIPWPVICRGCAPEEHQGLWGCVPSCAG